MQQSPQSIETLEAALMESLHEAGESVSEDRFVSLCRRAPSPRLLDALLAQQEALSYLASQATEEGAPYWNEGGDGSWTVGLGKAALQETWWPYHNRVRVWAETNHSALTEVLKQPHATLVGYGSTPGGQRRDRAVSSEIRDASCADAGLTHLCGLRGTDT